MSFNPIVTKPAAHSLRRAEMVSSLAEADLNEDFFPQMMLRISEGVYLSEIAKECRVTYSVLRNWIRGNKARDEEYKKAEADGKTARAEKVMQKIYDVATAPVAAEITNADQMRAAEIYLKQDGQQESRQGPSTIANIAITFVAAQEGKEKTVDPVP